MDEVKSKILVVEDDKINRTVISKIIEMTGYLVIAASDGYEAVEIYREHKDIDAVIMDIQLPGMDGIETKNWIRQIQSERGEYVPVIALTAYSGEENVKFFLECGFDACEVKPVDFELFRKNLAEQIKKEGRK